jgi:phage repressor protein C with HTH and peptisase S24 domain
MEEFRDRLAWIRRERGFKKPVDAARAFGWKEPTYYGHENGDRMPGRETAERYAKAFRVPLGWLLNGEGGRPDIMREEENSIRVMGRVGAGAEILPEFEQMDSYEGLYSVQTVLDLPHDAVAFEVAGESMVPKYEPGDIVVCRVSGAAPEDVVGAYAAIQTSDGRRFVKRLLKGAMEGTFDLESQNALPIRGVHILWTSPILAVIPAQQWRRLDGNARRKMLGTPAKDIALSEAEQIVSAHRDVMGIHGSRSKAVMTVAGSLPRPAAKSSKQRKPPG